MTKESKPPTWAPYVTFVVDHEPCPMIAARMPTMRMRWSVIAKALGHISRHYGGRRTDILAFEGHEDTQGVFQMAFAGGRSLSKFELWDWDQEQAKFVQYRSELE